MDEVTEVVLHAQVAGKVDHDSVPDATLTHVASLVAALQHAATGSDNVLASAVLRTLCAVRPAVVSMMVSLFPVGAAVFPFFVVFSSVLALVLFDRPLPLSLPFLVWCLVVWCE